MDLITKSKKSGEPFEPVPPHRWNKNVISSEDDNSPCSFTSSSEDGDHGSYDECSSGVASSDENVVNTNNSPHSKKKTTVLKSSWQVPPNQQNISRMGEQTPHTTEKLSTKAVTSVQSNAEGIAMRVEAAASPQTIRVRDVPLPTLSWTDCSDLSQLLCYKEDISVNERNAYVFRKDPNLNNRMRAILFDWLMEVCDVYKLRRVTYYLAIDYIDRYLSKTEMIKKNHLQLLGITCLFIAAKVEEIYPPKLAELAYVTDGACTDTDMLAKEMEILSELRWDVNPITVTGWLCLYLQLACTKANEIRELMRRLNSKDDDIIYPQFSPHLFMTGCMLVDLCSLDDGMMYFKYSVIAASVVYYVLNREKALFVSGYTWNNISRCVEWMDPFALVVFRTLNVKPLMLPRDVQRNDSALRVVNPNIVLEDGHTLQNHVVDLAMLEEVHNEIKIMRQNYKSGKTTDVTGWTVSAEGFDASDNSKRKPKFKTNRFCYFPHKKNDEQPAEKSSEINLETEDKEKKEDQSKFDGEPSCVESSKCNTINNEDSPTSNNKCSTKCNTEKNSDSSEIKIVSNEKNQTKENNSNNNSKSKSSFNKIRGKKRRRNSSSS